MRKQHLSASEVEADTADGTAPVYELLDCESELAAMGAFCWTELASVGNMLRVLTLFAKLLRGQTSQFKTKQCRSGERGCGRLLLQTNSRSVL